MSFPPHEFIQIGGKLSQVNSLHPLELALDPVPIAFYILCVHSRLRVYEADGVIHCAMIDCLM